MDRGDWRAVSVTAAELDMAVATWHAHMHSPCLRREMDLIWPKPISLMILMIPTIKSGASLHFLFAISFSTSVAHFPVVSSLLASKHSSTGLPLTTSYFLANLLFTFFCANFHFFFLAFTQS